MFCAWTEKYIWYIIWEHQILNDLILVSVSNSHQYLHCLFFYHTLSFGVMIITCFQLASVWFVVVNLIASGILLGQIMNPKIVFFSGEIIKDILLRKNIYRFQLSICKLINKGKKQVSLNLDVHTANSISGFIKK